MFGVESIKDLDKEDDYSYKEKALNWGKKALAGTVTTGLIFGASFLPVTALADDKKKVKVPLDEVTKTSKLSAEQWSESQVTVPRSWVNQDYLEKHFPQGGVTSEPKEKVTDQQPSQKVPSENNIPDGTLKESPKIIYDQNESIDVSEFNFNLTYDQGDLKDSKINFTVKNESGNIEDVKLILNGEQQLKPEDGKYDEAVEEFSKLVKGLEEGNLYEGQLKIKGEDNSDQVKFQIYPRMYLDIADDDDVNIGAHYFLWYQMPGHWDSFAHVPEVGAYDSRNDEVIAKHIDWATGHGIDFFLMGWAKEWAKDWPSEGGKDWLDDRLKNFLNNPLADDIKYSLTYLSEQLDLDSYNEGEGLDFSKSEVQNKFTEDIEYVISEYFPDDNYFKINGNPFFYIWAHDNYKGPFKDVIGGLNEEALKGVGKEIYWVGQQWMPSPNRREQREVADATAVYSPLNEFRVRKKEDSKLNRDLIDNWFVPLLQHKYLTAKDTGVDYIPEITPGFEKPEEVTGGNKIAKISRDPEGFRYEISKAKDFIDPKTNTIIIESWNEWPESTAIEPGGDWGSKYLEIIKDELNNYVPKGSLIDDLNHIELKYDEVFDPEGADDRKLAIKSPQINFYDSAAMWKPNLRIDIGTMQGRQFMGEGWYGDEVHDGETVAYGGGPEKESSIYIPKDLDAKYMRLEAESFPGFGADVYLNDEKIGRINFSSDMEKRTLKIEK